MMKLYFENDAIRIYIDKKLRLGVGEWKGFANSDKIRETALKSLEVINDNNLIRWLADRKNMKAIRQQDQEWTVEVFVPKMLASPLLRMASIVSEDLFNRMGIESILQRSGGLGAITLRDFDNPDEALEWLKQPLQEQLTTGTTGKPASTE